MGDVRKLACLHCELKVISEVIWGLVWELRLYNSGTHFGISLGVFWGASLRAALVLELERGLHLEFELILDLELDLELAPELAIGGNEGWLSALQPFDFGFAWDPFLTGVGLPTLHRDDGVAR